MCFRTSSIGRDPHAVDISPIKDHYISGVLEAAGSTPAPVPRIRNRFDQSRPFMFGCGCRLAMHISHAYRRSVETAVREVIRRCPADQRPRISVCDESSSLVERNGNTVSASARRLQKRQGADLKLDTTVRKCQWPRRDGVSGH